MQSVSLPCVPPGLSMRKCGDAGSASHLFVWSASCSTACPFHNAPPGWVHQPLPCLALHPSCPSPPLLPVWMNVSSLSPWLLDFYTIRFSVSSGCFLFLNCCPSFGCVRRHSVSTYTSILARSLQVVFSLQPQPSVCVCVCVCVHTYMCMILKKRLESWLMGLGGLSAGLWT